MNAWMVASVALLFALIPCGWLALTGSVQKRLVAVETAGVLCTLELMSLTMAFNRMPMMDLAVALALLSFGSGMVFAHFLARYL
ncbi:MAG TPA: monovalent cation/H+ antiporter complex subunit F [Terriglobales bacterium]|jgi:multisubunit Na+/H+ antiporter MnhF subunit|nr:monovalent cation/H+ antiporter complex subunit F [Terriglobales bacterium]